MKVLIKKSSKNSAPRVSIGFLPPNFFGKQELLKQPENAALQGLTFADVESMERMHLGLLSFFFGACWDDGWMMDAVFWGLGCWDVFLGVVSDHFSNRFCEPLQISFWVKLAAAKAPENWCLEDECPFGAYFQGVKLGLRKKNTP